MRAINIPPDEISPVIVDPPDVCAVVVVSAECFGFLGVPTNDFDSVIVSLASMSALIVIDATDPVCLLVARATLRQVIETELTKVNSAFAVTA